MGPILFDWSAYLGVVQSSVKTQLADAPGSEVKEIVGYQAATISVQYYIGGARDRSVYLPFDSEVIQSSRCILIAKWLFGVFGVRLLAKLISRWLNFKLESMNCKAAAWL
ncbi:hypothetical protein N9J84_04265 [Porticoccaceae bacterium]|nr:hypothetical protein [Porticoccaceae bacterium]